LIWNFSTAWAAKSFRSMGFAALQSGPAMKARNGYEATAMRSRGFDGKCRSGAELAWAKAVPSHTPAAVAHCLKNRLLVVAKFASLAW
jgi:hypothetical protein